jgi:two-component system, OmpR family, response regulator RegX3
VSSGRILIADDEPSVRDSVGYALAQEGFEVTPAADGDEASSLLGEGIPFDLLILDIMMPGPSGLDICRDVRARSAVPIIVLTAKDAEVDKVVGLEVGADDYVTKPFSPRELAARVKAVIRRAVGPPPSPSAVLAAGLVQVDTRRREARVDGRVVALTTREFALLEYLVENRGLALSRQQLLDGVWGIGWYGDERTVDVHVGQLRKKLGDSLPLMTVWGVGYRLD